MPYKRRFRKRQKPGSTGIKGALKRLGSQLTGPPAKKIALNVVANTAKEVYNKYANNRPKAKAKKTKQRHTSVNGGGNVIHTIVNIGETDKKLLKYVQTKGAYTTSQYLYSFSHANASTTGNLQHVNDTAEYLKGQVVGEIIANAFNQNAAWQALAPTLTTAGSQAKIFIGYVKSEIELINLSPAVTFVDIYLFRAKVDQLSADNAVSTYNLPSNAWTLSLDQEKGVGTVAKTFPGMEPRGAYFRKNFKEIYKLRCCMTGGEVRRLSLYMHLNKWMEYAKVITHKGNLAGITHHLMLVERGSPCGNLNDPFTTDTEIYYSPCKINGTVNTTFGVGCWVRPSNNTYTTQTGLTSTYNANVYTITDEDGNPQNIGVADTFG